MWELQVTNYTLVVRFNNCCTKLIRDSYFCIKGGITKFATQPSTVEKLVLSRPFLSTFDDNFVPENLYNLKSGMPVDESI